MDPSAMCLSKLLLVLPCFALTFNTIVVAAAALLLPSFHSLPFFLPSLSSARVVVALPLLLFPRRWFRTRSSQFYSPSHTSFSFIATLIALDTTISSL